LARGVKIDFAFVDGWHTFDYTLIDFFYIDKILRSGGLVSFHSMTVTMEGVLINPSGKSLVLRCPIGITDFSQAVA